MQDKIESLSALAELYKSNTISRDEYEKLKGELLNNVAKVDSLPKKQVQNTFNNTQKSKPKTLNKKSEFVSIIISVILVVILISIFSKDNNKSSVTTPTSTSNSSSTNINNSQSQEPSYKCKICGTTINGKGYCEDGQGNWRPCIDADNTMPYICSYTCAMRKKQRIDDAFKKVEDKVNNLNNGERCLNCGVGHYQNGFCDVCGGASRQRVEESRSKLPKCALCNGTGIEMPQGANTGGETGRICPACNGSGHSDY